MRGAEVQHCPVELLGSGCKVDQPVGDAVNVRIVPDICQRPWSVEPLNQPCHVHVDHRLWLLEDSGHVRGSDVGPDAWKRFEFRLGVGDPTVPRQ